MNVVGARPQFVKVAPIVAELDRRGVVNTLVHTGQHYDASLSDDIISSIGLRAPDVNLGCGSGTHAVQTGRTMVAVEELLLRVRPDVVVVYGDTNATLAATLAATKVQVPVAHVEAGLRSGNRNMPEELNRIAADHLSEVLFAPTDCAVANLRREGLSARTVRTTDVMLDALVSVAQSSRTCDWWPDTDFVVCTLHRAENTDNRSRLSAILEALASLPFPVCLLAHPRLLARAATFGLSDRLNAGALVSQEALPYADLIATMRRCAGVITDSGGLQKEAFLLRVPCVTLRAETEWPETLSGGWNVLVPDGFEVLAGLVQRAPEETEVNPFDTGVPARHQIVDFLLQGMD